DLTYLNGSDKMDKAVEFLLASGFTAVPVVDEVGRLEGIVSEGDFLRIAIQHGCDEMKNMTVRDIVHLSVDDYVLNSTDTDKIMDKIIDRNFLSVIDDRNIFIGIITRRSVMLQLKRK
ncbi:MAG: CBS domain-containing protein, partial [Lachnospiraceae bacterium]|nr:CBS domain-containing protein [Lachnospiraceae bacterium]